MRAVYPAPMRANPVGTASAQTRFATLRPHEDLPELRLPHSAKNDGRGPRILDHPPHRLFDLIKELGAEPEPLQVVEVRCFAQVASGIGVKADPTAHALVARSSAKTSSVGIGFTVPEAIS
jgi:hypothetical protein